MRRFLTTLCLSLVLLSTSCTKMFRDELNEIHTEIDDIKSRLDSICNAMNNNIASLKSIVTAMQNNDYVKSITPIIENGKEVGYEIVFTQSGKITIYHGKDGAAGDGTDGKDGHTPVIGVKQDVDGKWYWTVDGTWLLDSNGNKVKAVGEDGKDGQDGEDGKDGQDGEDGKDGQDGEDGNDGQNGEDGKDGQDGEDGKDGEDGEDGEDGVTPRLKIVDGYWYVSYDNGETWEPEPLGPATGASGSNGDAFFKDVDYNDESITLILADGTSLTIPTQKAHDALEARLSKLEVNVSSLQAIITAIQDNDYVKSVTPILENGVEVGYEIEFTKSGKIQIYHGESGEDGVTPELPVLTVKMHEEYGLCWWYGDDYVKDPETGKPVRAEAQDGRIPEFRIDEYGDWYVSYDGIHFQYVGQATGDSFFKSVNEIYAVGEDGKELVDAFGQKIVAYIEIVIFLDKKGNTATYRLPTEYTLNELAQRVDALEAQFKSLDALVNSLTNAEYIKEIVEIYGNTPQVIGYELTLVSLVVENGKFVEKITKKEILLAPTSGAVGIKYDGKTRTYYWTINGKELKDDKGNLIPASGPEKIIPEVKVEKNEWYFSVDGGKTWIATGISADGAGKPCIDAVEGDNDSDYFKFWLSDGTYISVPSWKAFENLQKEVTAIKNDINTFNTLLSKQAFVSKVEKDDKTGVVTVYYKSYDNEKGTWTETKGITFQEFTGVETFTKNGVEYWKIGGIETDIRVGHFTPEFVISGGKLYMSLVEKPGNDYTNAKEWKEIGNVGDLGGKTLTGISEDKQTGKITFTFSNGDVLVVPSWDWFNKAIAGIQADITAISTFVQGGKYITDVTEKDGVITIKYRTYDAAVKQWSEEKTEILNKDSYVSTYTENGVQYWLIAGVKTGIKVEHTHVPAITVNADGEICVDGKALGHLTNGKHVTDVKTEGEKITFTFHNGTTVAVPTFEAFQRLQQTVTAIQDDIAALQTFVQGGKYITDITEANGTITIKYREYDAQTKKWGEEKTETLNKDSYVSTYVENNVQYWLIAGKKTGIKVEHTHVPAITVNADGEICVDGKPLGHLTDGNHVTEVKTEGDKITFTFHNGASVAVPTYAAFVSLLERVAGIEGDIAALQTFVQGGKYITDITEANGTITIKYREYDAQTKKWGEEKTETLNKDSYVSTYVENNVQYWLIAGVKTGIKVEHTHVPAITVNENGEICVDGKALGHLTDGNHVTEVKTEGDKITFSFFNGTSVEVPTYAAFGALLERVAGIESDIKALQTFVQPGRYITAVTEKDGVITISYRQYDAVSGWSEEKTEVLNKDSYVSTYVENDVQYWLIAGVKTGIKVEHTHVPAITVNENGEICVDGTALGYLTDGAHVTGVVTTDNKITITFHNGASIDVPTYDAFVALQETVTGIQNDIKVLQTFVQDGKYITDVTEKDGVITIKYRTYDAANKMWTTEQTQVLNQNSYVSTYTENGVQYWLIAGQKTGIKVEHTHVPAITVNADGQICVDGKPLEGHLTDGNHVTEVKTEGGKITFSFFNGTSVEVPTYAAFVALLERVAGIEGDIAALQTFVQGGKYITDITEANGTITIKYREYDAQTKKWGEEKTETLNKDSYVSTYVENNVQYWLIAGVKTGIKVEHTHVPAITVNENGEICVDGKALGHLTDGNHVTEVKTEGDKITFSFFNGTSVEVPTYAAFVALQETVTGIQNDIKALQTFVQPGRYITAVTEKDGVITISYRQYDAVSGWSEEKTEVLNKDSYVSTYVENDVQYWLIAGVKTGIKVEHTHVPAITVNENGEICVDGEPLEGHLTDGNHVTEVKTEGDKITFSFFNGTSVEVPTYAAFGALQEAVAKIEGDIAALQTFVQGGKYITDITEANGTITIKYREYDAQTKKWGEEKTETLNKDSYVSTYVENDVQYWLIAGVKTGIKVEHTHVPAITVNENGEICVDGKALGHLTDGNHVTEVKTEGDKITFTFHNGASVAVPTYAAFVALLERVAGIESDIAALQTFVQPGRYITAVTEKDGVITISYRQYDAVSGWSEEKTEVLNKDSYVSTYVENDVQYWLIAGVKTGIKVEHTHVPAITVNENGEICVDGTALGYLTDGAHVTGVVTTDNKITITFHNGASIDVPTYAAFVVLQDAVTNMKTDLEALNALFAGDNKFVTDVKDENGKLIVYYVTRGANGWTSSSEAVFNLNSYISVQDGYWVINGVKTEYKVEHPDIPEITVNDKGEICVDGEALGYLTGGKHVINVTTDDVKVTFTFADGTSVVLPMYTELAITGLKSRYVLNSDTQTIEFGYTGVKNGDTPQVFTICENGWSTDTPKVNDGKVTMKVTAPAGDAPQGKVLVFLSYNGKVVMAQAVLIYPKDITSSGDIIGSNGTYNKDNGTFYLEWYSRGSFTVTATSGCDLTGAAVEFEYEGTADWLGTTAFTKADYNFKIYSDYNTTSALRKAKVKITLDGTLIAEFNVEQEGRINLSTETANSYIVTQNNNKDQVAYAFKATKGHNGGPVSSENTSPTGNNISAHPTVVKIGDDYWISFDISNWTESNRYISMNGWKWHIWCTGAEEVGGILDRNLGATSTNDKGLTYQWGRPIDDSNYVAAMTTGDWAADKTASDPCPAGYKVIGRNKLPQDGTRTNDTGDDPIFKYDGVSYPATNGTAFVSTTQGHTYYWTDVENSLIDIIGQVGGRIGNRTYYLELETITPGNNQTGYVRCVKK